MASRAEAFLRPLIEQAGITVGGDGPSDVAVHDSRLYQRLMTQGTLGLGESYMDGWWDSPNVDQLIHKVLKADIKAKVPVDIGLWISLGRGMLTNLQRSRAYEVGERHYDIGNDLYEAMLDKRLIYSCGYWRDSENLDAAQEAKLDLICRKIGLEKGMKLLDIGCGWGGFLQFAAERYGISGVGVSVSKEQIAYAKAHSDGLDLEFRLEDYLDTTGTFDRIVSVGMFEHVGYKNYRRYMEKAAELLSDDGLFLLHSIGGNHTVTHGDPWSEKYIFPNGMLPSIRQIGTAAEGVFVMEDWHNFGADYDKTLMAWHQNFEAAWPRLKGNYGHSERFYRMWRYYLLSFAATFRARNIQLWQIVLSKHGLPGGYRSIR